MALELLLVVLEWLWNSFWCLWNGFGVAFGSFGMAFGGFGVACGFGIAVCGCLRRRSGLGVAFCVTGVALELLFASPEWRWSGFSRFVLLFVPTALSLTYFLKRRVVRVFEKTHSRNIWTYMGSQGATTRNPQPQGCHHG